MITDKLLRVSEDQAVTTTAVSTNSGNGYSDGNSEGKFSYQPPSGYYALNTKNYNTYG